MSKMSVRATADGKQISLLGYGAMRLPTVDGGHANNWMPDVSNKEIDQAELNRQVRYMLEHGLNYFDTSPVYCKGRSEAALGEALSKSAFKRSEYVIATKLSNFAPTKWSLDSAKEMFETSLKNLHTDYIDNYLLHSVGNGGMDLFSKRYLDNGALEWCLKLREEKRIRNLGFSFHGDIKVFDYLLERHDKYHWDFCQIQMNYIDWEHASGRNANAKMLYDRLTALKIPVVIMEPLLGGRLGRYNWALANEFKVADPSASLAKWAFRFCGSFDNVMTILSGITYAHHLEEDIEIFSPLKRFDEQEFALASKAAEAYLNLETIPCNSCDYCMPCPYGLDIPGILTFRNRIKAAKETLESKEILKSYYSAIPEPLRRADHCTGCGRCQSHCPQMIDIPSEIAKIDAWIDNLKTEVASEDAVEIFKKLMRRF